MKKLRWGVLGTGHIIGKGGAALKQAGNGEWLGVAGRNAENGRNAAERFGVPRAYAGYRELLDDPDIDAVYIALLNHLHAEWAMAAINAGKHVLLEKPFALSAGEAAAIVRAARDRGVHVEEAFVWRHQEGHAFVRDAIAAGAIGEPVLFKGHFSFQAQERSTRLVAEWGGGALYDIGCYLVAWSRYQFGQEPEWADCRLIRSGEQGVDRKFAAMLAFPNGRTAQLFGALDMPYGCGYEIRGTEGKVELESSADAQTVTLRVSVNGETRDFTTDRVTPFRLQAERFAERVLRGELLPDDGQSILTQARAMDALFASDKAGARVKVVVK
ncbi:Gfo/Idh/MocA family oxidoreductase [Paenibacillus cisolokensis]|uniref:Gfo/Idh/MocA family protein n=1 Tax=Paenibacillus cisolokensis TaxID=1658519 RepID=UPI003D2CEB6D